MSTLHTPPPCPDPSPLAWGPNLVIQPTPDAATWVVSALVAWRADAPDPLFSLDGEWAGSPQRLAECLGLRWGRVVFRLARQRQGRWVEYRWGFPGLERQPGAWDGMGLGRASFHVPGAGQVPRVVLAQVPALAQDVQAWAQDILVHGDWPSTTLSQCDGPTLSSSAAGPVDVLLLDGRMASLSAHVWGDPMVRAWLEAPLEAGQPPELPTGLGRRLAELCMEAHAWQAKPAWRLEAHDPPSPELLESGEVETGLQACHLGARLPAIWSQTPWQAGLPEDEATPWPLPPDDPRRPVLRSALAAADRAARRLFLAHLPPEPWVRLADEQARLEREWGLSCCHRWGDTVCWVLDPEAAALQDPRCTLAEGWLAGQALGVARAQCPPRDADGLPVLRHGDTLNHQATGLAAWTRPWVDRRPAQVVPPVRGWCLDAGGHLARLRSRDPDGDHAGWGRLSWWTWPAGECPAGDSAGLSAHPEWDASEAGACWRLVEVISRDGAVEDQDAAVPVQRPWATGLQAISGGDAAALAGPPESTHGGSDGPEEGSAWAMRWWWRWRPQSGGSLQGPGWSHARGGPGRDASSQWPLASSA